MFMFVLFLQTKFTMYKKESQEYVNPEFVDFMKFNFLLNKLSLL